MGYPFHLKIFNYSDSEIEFTISNAACMDLPETKTRKAKPKSWVVFDNVKTSNSVFNLCMVSQSKFTISAKRGGKLIGNTTYRIYSTLKRSFYNKRDGRKLSGMHWLAEGVGCDALVMERTDSYGDMFYNGRGLYFEDNIKGNCKATSLEQAELGPVEKMMPTALVNSNRQFLQETDDNSLGTLVGRAISLGLSVADVYGFVSARNEAPKTAAAVRALEWKDFQGQMLNYYQFYRNVICDGEELSIVVAKIDHAATFHLLFEDNAEHAGDIMLGNFHMPPPPTDGNTFYANILHLSADAARKMKT